MTEPLRRLAGGALHAGAIALPQAWFEDQPWIAYDGARGRSERTVRIEQVVMDKAETRLHCFDLDKQAPRQFQLHRIAAAAEYAEVLLGPSSDDLRTMADNAHTWDVNTLGERWAQAILATLP